MGRLSVDVGKSCASAAPLGPSTVATTPHVALQRSAMHSEQNSGEGQIAVGGVEDAGNVPINDVLQNDVCCAIGSEEREGEVAGVTGAGWASTHGRLA
jgi:hypothetical protein